MRSSASLAGATRQIGSSSGKGARSAKTLAGKYRHVIDYYLHGGEEKLREAVADMTAILKRDLAAGEASAASASHDAAEMSGHLDRVFKVLDTDPHYRYDFSVDLTPPEITRRENMIAATQVIQPDGHTLTFRVYRRFAESQHERPVPFNLRFASEDAAFDADAFDSWRKYGTPLSAPAEVDIDLPGGLGAPFAEGLAQVSVESAGHDYDVRFRVRRADGTLGPALSFSITARTGPEQTGVWEIGKDQSGYLTFETKTDLETGSGTWGFNRSRIVGQEFEKVLPSIESLQDIVTGNVLQVAHRVGPFADYREIPSHDAAFPEAVMTYLRSLSIIQAQTSTPLLVPDLTMVTSEEARAAVEAAAMLSGHTVVSRWDAIRFLPEAAPEVGSDLEARQVDLESHYLIKITCPLIVKVGDQELALGATERWLLSAAYEEEGGGVVGRPFLNDTAYRIFVPDVPPPDRNYQLVQAKLLGKKSEASERKESAAEDDAVDEVATEDEE